jgi:hypothetical protein
MACLYTPVQLGDGPVYDESPVVELNVHVYVVVAGPEARSAVAVLHDTVHVLPTAMLRHAAMLYNVLTGGVVQFLGTHLGKAPWKVDCPAWGFDAPSSTVAWHCMAYH